MEENMLYTMLSIIIFLLVTMKIFMQNKHKHLPPSPLALPIIGHLHLLKRPINRCLHNLSQKYGPIFTLRFGNRLAIVVSSAEIAEECLTTNDVIFANRPHYSMPKYTDYNQTTLPTVDYGDHWRSLRRIWTLEILSTQRINESESIRKEEIGSLLHKLYKISCKGFAEVEIKPLFFSQLTNVILRLISGKRYFGEEDVNKSEEARKFKEIIKEYMELADMTTFGDMIPMLKWFDHGNTKKFKELGEKMDSFCQGLIDELRIYKSTNSIVDYLLGMQESQPLAYSDEIIKGLTMVMATGGAETLSIALEWAMANLLNNPTVLEKAKEEIDTKIGTEHLIEESDLPKLSYLQSIIYETLRISPIFPFIVPHQSSKDCTIGGYHVPANTMLFVNAWTIQRDPTLWDDPTEFKPERFENGKASRLFKFLPFGYGRRICPGEKFAYRGMSFTLGLLIQCFEWERTYQEKIDMSERTGVLMSKLEPLKVMCKARPILHKVFDVDAARNNTPKNK